MKILYFFFASIFFSALCFAKPGHLIAGEVKFIKGSATLDGQSIKVGTKLHEDQVIKTDKDSFVRILLSEGIAFQLGPNSHAKMVKKSKGRATILDLTKGYVLSRVEAAAKGKREKKYEVRTKNAALGVRGTAFFVENRGKLGTFVCVCNGSVAVRWETGREIVTTKHHESPKLIGPKGQKLEALAEMGHEHSDEEIALLGKMLGTTAKK